DDVMQPTLLKQGHEMFISIHVDDLLMAGMEDTLCRFLAHLVNRALQDYTWEIDLRLYNSDDLEEASCVTEYST
ncbi:unnamed protein product, partial [Effrenium voratum]